MGKTLTNLMRFHYIELPKVTQDKRSIEELTEEARFLEYLKYAGEPIDRHDHEKDGSWQESAGGNKCPVEDNK